MDRVVAAQGELLSELSGLARELCVDADQRQFALQFLEILQRAPVGGDREACAAPCCRECRAPLRVAENA